MTGPTPSTDDWRERLAAAAQELGDFTGDERFKRAAGALRGARSGRKPVDDAKALDLAKSYLAAGLEPSKRAACVRAAKLYVAEWNDDAPMVRRLLRKWK